MWVSLKIFAPHRSNLGINNIIARLDRNIHSAILNLQADTDKDTDTDKDKDMNTDKDMELEYFCYMQHIHTSYGLKISDNRVNHSTNQYE